MHRQGNGKYHLYLKTWVRSYFLSTIVVADWNQFIFSYDSIKEKR